MRLLPRSRRGTWLLAGAVWCAACAGLWWALPVVPRADVHLPDGMWLLDVGKDGRTAFVQRGSGAWPYRTELYLIDLQTEAALASLIDDSACLTARHCSGDGRLWTFLQSKKVQGQEKLTYVKVELGDRTLKGEQFGPSHADVFGLVGLTHDGRFCLIAPDPNVAPTFVWDMARNRKHGDIPYEAWPVGPDLDGKPMILAWSGPDHHGLKLIDAESLAARAALTIREDPLTVEQRPYYNRGNLFLNTNPGLHVYDFATATVRFEIPETYFQAFSSPDGRLLFAHQGIFGESLLELLAARLGYKLSSPPSGRDEYSLYSNVTGEKLTPLFTCDWGSRVPWWWLTQQGTLATGDATDDHILHIWDIPPRKSLSWFTAGAALLALPNALLAWRRNRRLRAA